MTSQSCIPPTSETLVVSTRVNINEGRLSHERDLRGIVERSVHCSKPLQRPGWDINQPSTPKCFRRLGGRSPIDGNQ